MTAIRSPLMLPPIPPYNAIAIGRTAKGTHGTALAWLANEVRWAGGTVFHLANPGSATSSSPTFHVHVPFRRQAERRLWIVGYKTPQIPGQCKLILGQPPVNVADPMWADGIWVSGETDSRRPTKPLRFYEVVDSGAGYNTLPSSGQAISFQLYWPGSASTSLEISYVSCYEFVRNREVTDDIYGVDVEPFEARRAVYSASVGTNVTDGVRQLLAMQNTAGLEHNYRAMFQQYNASGLSTHTSHTPNAMNPDIVPRVHPRRMYRTNPGWSYTATTAVAGAVRVWFLARNSARADGVITVKSAKDTTGVTATGFSVSPDAATWVSCILSCYNEECFATRPEYTSATPRAATVGSVRGMLPGNIAGDDTDADGADRATSAWEESLTVTAAGKLLAGDAANTLTIYGMCVTQI